MASRYGFSPGLCLLEPLGVFALLLAGMPSMAGEAAGGAASLFSSDRYRAHVEFLASDGLTGRGVETDGSWKAADYIVKEWEKAGLRPGFHDQSWFQEFDVPSQKVLEADKAELAFSLIQRPLVLGEDWTPLPYSAIADAEGTLAFAGYGIDAPEYDYDDYLDIDVRDKIVLIFRYEPRDKDPAAEFGGSEASRFAAFREKAATAVRHGAKALLIVNPPDHPLGAQDALIAFERWMTRPTYELPMAQVTQKVADELLRAAGMPDLREMQRRLDADRQSWSEDLPQVRVSLKPGIRAARGRNIVAVRRGADATNEDVIVVGAHYDHLGSRPSGEESAAQIHNGADDNASGVAALLELGRALMQEPPLQRTVVLIAFDAEELGLLGSRHFVLHSPWPMGVIKAMLNLDMIGRYRADSFEISGTGSMTGAEELIQQAVGDSGLTCKLRERVRRDSDQLAFDGQAVPTLFLHTGTHPDYHRPTDDTDKIDYDNAVRIVALAHRLTTQLANMPSGPEYIVTESAPTSRPGRVADRRRSAVRLGFTPKDDENIQGVVVDTVAQGGAGAAAGLKPGDKLLRIGEREIREMADYFEALQPFQVGDSTTLQVERDGKAQDLQVTFTRTRGRPADPS